MHLRTGLLASTVVLGCVCVAEGGGAGSFAEGFVGEGVALEVVATRFSVVLGVSLFGVVPDSGFVSLRVGFAFGIALAWGFSAAFSVLGDAGVSDC